MTTTRTALAIAKERQLDWLLGDVLGAAAARGPTASVRLRPWLAAAVLALGLAAAFGTALLRDEPATAPAQEPSEAIEWYECHGPAQIDQVPADVVNLKCFDFDDAAMVHLGHFANLLRLDLSGMDVNDRGYSVSLKITDAGLLHLNGVLQLRWLSLAGCHEVKGPLLVLENLPRLKHLDLTYTGVESPAIERLPWLFSLRELSLSYCMNFHGRSLAEVAKVPGLRRLELRGCTTLAAADVMHLAKLTQLRHLDLRDCQGRYRGQRAVMLDDVTNGEAPEPPPPPVEDGIGITDASIAALALLKLETLLLGGSESLTDAVGATLAKMTTLRELDLSSLPKTTGALLGSLPAGLRALALDHNTQFAGPDLARLRPLSDLRELGLSGLRQVRTEDLAALLEGKSLHELRLGGVLQAGKGAGPAAPSGSGMTPAIAVALAGQQELRRLDLADTKWPDRSFFTAIAKLPQLAELDLSRSSACTADVLEPLAGCRSLRSIRFLWCQQLDVAALRVLESTPLRQLDLYGTNLVPDDIREIAKAWPGCTITLPDGQRYRVPQ